MQICRLCECKPAVFDAKLNDDMLTDCLRRVLDIYDSHSDASSELMDSIFALHFIHGSEGILRLISLHFHKGYIYYCQCSYYSSTHHQLLLFQFQQTFAQFSGIGDHFCPRSWKLCKIIPALQDTSCTFGMRPC